MCDVPVPPAVRDALEEYRRLLAEHGPTWGEDRVRYVRQIETSAYLMDEQEFWAACLTLAAERHPGAGDAELERRMAELDPHEIVRAALAGRVLDNLAALRLTPGGTELDARPSTPTAAPTSTATTSS